LLKNNTFLSIYLPIYVRQAAGILVKLKIKERVVTNIRLKIK